MNIQEGERRGKEEEGEENKSEVQVNGADADGYGGHCVEYVRWDMILSSKVSDFAHIRLILRFVRFTDQR